MRVVGNGFLAGCLRERFADSHAAVTALAAGVSSTSVTAAQDFDREAHLLYETLERCRRERSTLVFFSTASFAMYGAPSVPATEDGPLCPPNTYGRHKLALEASVRSSGVDHLILRLSHLVGPGQREHQLLPAMVRQIESGKVTVFRGAYRDLLDVRDLCHALDGLLSAGATGRAFNVVSGRPVAVEDVVDGIEKRMGTVADRTVVQPQSGASARTAVSTERLRQLVPGFRGGEDDTYLDRLLDAYLPPYITR